MRTRCALTLTTGVAFWVSGLLIASAASATDVLGPDDFEVGFGNWSNAGGDDFDWTRDSGGTPSNNTGPSGDHTTGGGFYVYTEASNPRVAGEIAWLESPCIDLTSAGSADWEFWHNLNGAAMGTLRAQIASSTGSTCSALGAFSDAFTIAGEQGDVWVQANVALPIGGSVVLRFEGVVGSSFTGDMALDDVVVTVPCTSDAECNDGVTCTDDVCNLGTGVCENTDNCTGGAICNPSANMCQVPANQTLVDALDLDNFKLHIQNLSSLDPPINGTRYWSTAGNAAARDYIQAELESYGYTVERHSYTFQSTAMDQVYATKIGADPSRMYIVGAHMDSTNLDSGNPQVYAPGANDDASGTSLVLEAARVYAPAEVQTQVSIRFIFWNNEETGLDGSEAYVASQRSKQGVEGPAGVWEEPTWLGVIQHDMMMWDHGPGPLPQNPPWPPQDPNADVDIEYQASSSASAASAALASHFLGANGAYATDYPAQIGTNMCCTDSVPFEDDVASISLRENRRASEIGNDSDPHWHQDTDFYETFGPEDFLLGFNALQTTVGGLAELTGATMAGTCGDTVLDAGEQCDDGNTTEGDCCSATCQFESAATECRAAAGVCDVAEQCTGSSGTCPADGFEPVTTGCRAAAGTCDVAETCTGAGPSCPADVLVPGATECRTAVDICDVAEACDGIAPTCPTDSFEPVTTLCRASAGICDAAETCTGADPSCPADILLPGGAECRAQADVCDVAELCTGASALCPGDAFEPATTECRAQADVCDVAELCTGASALCPGDAFEPATTECRASADVCDVAETCTGAGIACPADGFEPATTECRAVAGLCDVVETCTGSGVTCPADGVLPAATECRASAGACDVADNCSGSAPDCPDLFVSAATECRASTDVCDVAEACTGADPACPADGYEPGTTICRAKAGACDVADSCTGADPACPPDGYQPAGFVCRVAQGLCDVEDQCSGAAPNCPNGFEPVTTLCRVQSGACDVADFCPGDASNCPNGVEPEGVVCRLGSATCEGDEVCDGVGQTCPPLPNPPLDCNDGNLCTADGCDMITGCFNTPVPGCVTDVWAGTLKIVQVDVGTGVYTDAVEDVTGFDGDYAYSDTCGGTCSTVPSPPDGTDYVFSDGLGSITGLGIQTDGVQSDVLIEDEHVVDVAEAALLTALGYSITSGTIIDTYTVGSENAGGGLVFEVGYLYVSTDPFSDTSFTSTPPADPDFVIFEIDEGAGTVYHAFGVINLPEPGASLMLGSGILGLLALARRRWHGAGHPVSRA